MDTGHPQKSWWRFSRAIDFHECWSKQQGGGIRYIMQPFRGASASIVFFSALGVWAGANVVYLSWQRYCNAAPAHHKWRHLLCSHCTLKTTDWLAGRPSINCLLLAIHKDDAACMNQFFEQAVDLLDNPDRIRALKQSTHLMSWWMRCFNKIKQKAAQFMRRPFYLDIYH